MRHIETVRNLGALFDFDVDCRADAEREEAERILDALFERGYQVGYTDGQMDLADWHKKLKGMA